MNYNTNNADKIDEYIKNNPDAKNIKDDDPCASEMIVKVRGKKPKFPTVILPLDLIFHNVKNGRYRDDYLELKKQVNPAEDPDTWELDATVVTDADNIRRMLKDVDPVAFAKMRNILPTDGQEEPGIITHDGYLYNANRRLAVLHELSQSDPTKFGFIRVVRLPKEIDGIEISDVDLYDVEIECQMGDDLKLDYSPINEILKIVDGIKLGKSVAEIADRMTKSEAYVKHQLELFEIMKEALDANGTPGEYHLLKEKYSYFDDMKKQLFDKQKNFDPLDFTDAKIIAFKKLWAKDSSHKDYRYFPKILQNTAIKNSFLEAAKVNEETGEEFDSNSTQEMFERAVEQLRLQENLDKPKKILDSINDGFNTIIPDLWNNDLLKKSICKNVIDEILVAAEELKKFRAANPDGGN